MNKKLLIAVAALTVILVVGIGGVMYFRAQTQTAPRSSATPSANAKITVTGKIGCLMPKDTSGPIELSCAIGLTTDDGKNYALSADDPSTLGMATGQPVEVTGVFTERSSKYNSRGVIKVESLRKK